MSEFRELNNPQSGMTGKYYVATKEGKTAWLTIHGDLSTDTSNMDLLFYDTKELAYEALAAYYRNHQHASIGIEKENGQQVMVFK